jgi:hypothetical protein
MAQWRISNYHKKTVEEVEHFIQSEGDGLLTTYNGFRWGEWIITTDGDDPPTFNWHNQRVNLLDNPGDDIVDVELVDMSDGGCWYEVEISGLDEEAENTLRDCLEANGTYELLDRDTDAWQEGDVEWWVAGPIEITNDAGYRQLVTATEADVQVNYEACEE